MQARCWEISAEYKIREQHEFMEVSQDARDDIMDAKQINNRGTEQFTPAARTHILTK